MGAHNDCVVVVQFEEIGEIGSVGWWVGGGWGNINVGKKKRGAVEGNSHGLVFQDLVVREKLDEECKSSAALSSRSIPADKVIAWKR